VYPVDSPEGDPDPVDSFSNVVQDVEAGETAPVGPGTAILINWVSGGKLSLNFEIAATIDPTGGEGGNSLSLGPCGALEEFEANARAQFSQNCASCHAGTNETATNAVDMTEIDTDAAQACGQIRNRVNPSNVNASQIFVNTDPNGNASHPFKFGGDINAFNDFRSAVSIWIQAEQ
jgi:hypothetical protein